MTDGVVLGVSGWFTPHGELYHEDERMVDEIAAADWTTLLDHAEHRLLHASRTAAAGT